MTPKRIAGIRKSFTCADIDDLCDEVERLWTEKDELEHKWVEEHESWHRLRDRLDIEEREVRRLRKELNNDQLCVVIGCGKLCGKVCWASG